MNGNEEMCERERERNLSIGFWIEGRRERWAFCFRELRRE